MNYKNKVALILLLGLFCQVATISAYLTNICVWRLQTEKGPIRILLLGDAHRPHLEDKEHKQALFAQIKRLNESQKHVSYMVEAPEDKCWVAPEEKASDFMKRVLASNDFTLLYCMGIYAILAQGHEVTHFIPGDIRSLKLQGLGYLYNKVLDSVYNNKLDELKKIPEWQKGCSVQEFFQEFDSVQMRTAKLCVQKDPVIKGVAQEFQEKLDIAKQKAKAFFEESSKKHHESVAEVVASFLQKDPLAGFQYFAQEGWLSDLILKDIADIGFLEKFNTLIQDGKDVIILTGAGHALPLFNILKRFETQNRATCLLAEGRYSTRAILDDQTNSVLSKEKFSFGLNIFEGVCFSCHKSAESMKTCGGCKMAKYCSAECQKKDWTMHKLVCKK